MDQSLTGTNIPHLRRRNLPNLPQWHAGQGSHSWHRSWSTTHSEWDERSERTHLAAPLPDGEAVAVLNRFFGDSILATVDTSPTGLLTGSGQSVTELRWMVSRFGWPAFKSTFDLPQKYS